MFANRFDYAYTVVFVTWGQPIRIDVHERSQISINERAIMVICLVQPWLLSSLGVVWPDGSRRGTALRDAQYKYAYFPVQTRQLK